MNDIFPQKSEEFSNSGDIDENLLENSQTLYEDENFETLKFKY